MTASGGLLSFHLWFAIFASVLLGTSTALSTPAQEWVGIAIFVVLISWNVAFPLRFRADTELYRMWRWAALISLFQVRSGLKRRVSNESSTLPLRSPARHMSTTWN
jgi:hypothetical protein